MKGQTVLAKGQTANAKRQTHSPKGQTLKKFSDTPSSEAKKELICPPRTPEEVFLWEKMGERANFVHERANCPRQRANRQREKANFYIFNETQNSNFYC